MPTLLLPLILTLATRAAQFENRTGLDLIPPEAFSEVRDHETHYRAIYQGKPVFLKRIADERNPGAAPWGDEGSRLTNAAGVGTRYLGLTFVFDARYAGSRGSYALAYDFVEGAHFCYLDDDLLTKPITWQTRRDIDDAVDRLNRNSILGVDMQFMLTPAGRAVLIDFDGFRERPLRDARENNESYRRSYRRAIYKNLFARACGRLLGRVR